MKFRGKPVLCLTFSSMLLGGLEVASANVGNNPYQAIIGRNSFALKSPAPAAQPETQSVAIPKITLQGINSILGRRQVLFKVAQPPKPPEPAKEVSYLLSEGERGGEVEVLEIDDKNGTIKFNNYGTQQTLTMERDAAKPTAGPAIAASAGAPGIPLPGGGAPVQSGGIRPPATPTIPNANPAIPTAGSKSINGMPTRSLRTAPPATSANSMSLEEAEIMTAVNHTVATESGSPTAGLFPPTRMNPTLNVSPPPTPK